MRKGVVVASSLPPYPNLEQLRKRAKDLRKAHGEGRREAAARLKAHLSRLAGLDLDAVLAADLALREAQHVVARECGFTDWEQLLAALREREAAGAPRRLIVDAVDYADADLVPVQIERVEHRQREGGERTDRLAFVVLADGPDRGFVVAIGEPEGTILSFSLAGRRLPRPLTHELLDACLDHLGAAVHSVVVHALVETTFLAHVRLETAAGRVAVDARPSDGLILAVQRGAPIYATGRLLEAIGKPLADAVRHIEAMQPVEAAA